MRRVAVAVTAVLMLVCQSGCGRIAPVVRQLLKTGGKSKVAAKTAGQIAITNGDEAAHARPIVPKVATQNGDEVVQSISGQNGGIPKVATKMPDTLLRSTTAGQRLLALKPHFPANIYAQLWNNWQRNNAELKSTERQLQDSSLSESRRNRLEAKFEDIARRQAEVEAEIERMAQIYG